MDLTKTDPNENLFDDAAGYEDDRGLRVAANLTIREKQQAATIYRLFNELWGLCIIRGDPGAGKDTFLNWLLYTVKRYFPQKRIVRDEKPRPLFGKYDALFNEQVIRDDLQRMREFARGQKNNGKSEKNDVDYMTALEKAADSWVGSDGAKVMLQNSVTGLTEFWKYVYNREPHNPMNKTMGGIHKMKRHLNILIVGCIQLESDLDRKTCKPFIDWRINCERSSRDSTRYTYLLEKVRYDQRKDVLFSVGRPFAIPLDAGKPRTYMGDGKIIIRKPDYLPTTDEERIVLDVLKAGVTDNTYEGLVSFLQNESDMTEWETLATLKRLCLKLPNENPKFAIWYPCYYFTFNSRSAPQMTTKLRMEV